MKHNIPVYNRFHFFILICALLDIIPKTLRKAQYSAHSLVANCIIKII